MNRPQITIGADPEFFSGNASGYKSAINRIGGWKTAPRSLGRPGFFVQEDNVAVEFNIPPAKTLQEFVESIQWATKEITDEVKGMQLEPRIAAAAIFPESELQDPQAQTFGCDPDFNAWRGGEVNPRPHCPDQRLRSCGGHIHIGYPFNTDVDKYRLIQLMDLYLGVPSVMMDVSSESALRRSLYGKAGAFRPTEYGVEYRVLSNFWIGHPKFIEWAYRQTHKAFDQAVHFGKPVTLKEEVEKFKEGENRNDYYHFMECNDLCDDIQRCINGNDPNVAQKLITYHNLDVVV